MVTRDNLANKNGDVGLGLTTEFRVCRIHDHKDRVEHDDQPLHFDWAHNFATCITI